MKRGIVIAMMLAQVGFGLRAQDDASADTWQLHKPTIAEYIVAAPQIVDQAYRKDEYEVSKGLPTVVYEELISRYGEPLVFHQKFDLLWDVYHSMAIGFNFQIPANPQTWSLALLRAWLRENPTDLKRSHRIKTKAFSVEVTQFDFNNDGEVEYLLNFANASPGLDQMYVIAQADRTQAEGYRLSLTPLPYVGRFSDQITRADPETGVLKTLRLEDINHDGLPEWIVLNNEFGYWRSCGKLFVLGWHDGRLVDFAAGGFDYCLPLNYSPDWIYTETNSTTEIKLQFVSADDAECPHEIRQSLVWEDSGYRLVDYSLPIVLLPQCQEKGIESPHWYWYKVGMPFVRLDDITIPLYQQALRFEAENRPDEALAEYVSIYEAAPESAWGMLARLHLEPSTG